MAIQGEPAPVLYPLQPLQWICKMQEFGGELH